MTEQKFTSIADFAHSLGMDDEVVEYAKKEVKKMALLRFRRNPTKPGIISDYNKGIVFLEEANAKDVNEDEVWICTVRTYSDNIYYATPIFKITPWILMNFDESLRKSITQTLWEQNRKGYEEEFEKKYQEEEFAKATEKVRNEFESLIKEKNEKIRELESQMQQDRVRMSTISQNANTIELTSDEENDTVAPVRQNYVTLDSRPVAEPQAPPEIRTTQVQTIPGFPERVIVGPCNGTYRRTVYRVVRESENVLYSDSFTDSRYFVHISNDCKMLVIRPHEYGTAYAVNRRITLKGLNNLSRFKEKCDLVAESSMAYDGMVVYLS